MNSKAILAVGLRKEDLLHLLNRMEALGCQVISALSLLDAGWIAEHRHFRLAVLDLECLRPDGAQAFLEAADRQPAMQLLVLHGEGQTWLARARNAVRFRQETSFRDVISVAVSLLR